MKIFFFALIGFLAVTGRAVYAFDHSHAAWSVILQKYVHAVGPASQVDYGGLKKETSSLESYLASLSSVSKKEFDGFSREEQMAFLINAYNGFTLQTVVQHYPIKSIKDIGSFFKNTWKIKFFKLFGEETNLDAIEHEMLRKNYKEPRIHFAVNCASIGCPALRNEAYTAARLNQQLEEQTKQFLRDGSRNKIDDKNMKLELSMIFDWFKEDFEREGSSVPKFVAKYITDDSALRAKVEKGEFKVSHLDYDWGLNKWKN